MLIRELTEGANEWAGWTVKVALISGEDSEQGDCEARMSAPNAPKSSAATSFDEQARAVEAELKANVNDAAYVHLDVTRETDWRRSHRGAKC